MKKVLIICPNYLPVPDCKGGAVENLITQIIEQNEIEKKFEIDVLTIKDDLNKYGYKYTKFIFSNNNLFLKLTNKRLFKRKWLLKLYIYKNIIFNKLNMDKYDYIVCENEPLLGKISYSKGKKAILHLHNEYINTQTTKYMKYYEKCLCVSDFLASTVKKVCDKVECTTLYNGVDLQKFSVDENIKNREIIRRGLGIKNTDIVYIFSGRIDENKGVYELIDAFKENHKNNEYLIVCGKPNFEKDKKWKNICREKNPNIKLLGYVNNSVIGEYYCAADVGCVPSKWNESFGMVVVEQMASNLIMMTTDCGAIPEIIGKDAVYVERDNLKNSIAKKMDYIRLNFDKLKNRTSSYKIEKFSKEKYFENFVKSIEKMENEQL